MLQNSSASGISCYENDVEISKPYLIVGDLFLGASLSIYGVLCPGNDYAVVSYLDDLTYKVSKNIRNSFNMVVQSDKGELVKYYGFFDIRGSKNFEKFHIYQKNDAIDWFLEKNNLSNIDNNPVNVKKNGIFKEKIKITKSAKPGKYITEIYVFDKTTGAVKSLNISSFDVVLQGNGSIIQDIMKKNRAIYITLCILSMLSISCIVAFLMDFGKKILSSK